MSERREITVEELGRRQKMGGSAMKNVKVSGTVVIKDKDGNVKSELDIVKIDSRKE